GAFFGRRPAPRRVFPGCADRARHRRHSGLPAARTAGRGNRSGRGAADGLKRSTAVRHSCGMHIHTTNALVAFAFVALTTLVASEAAAQQVECSSPANKVTGVTNPSGFYIQKKYQFDPDMQPLLTTTIQAEEGGCLIAHLSGQVRITDNYVAFQV